MTEKVLKKQMLRNAEYYDMTNVFDELYEKSIKNNTFNNLIPLISSRNNILMAYRTLKKNSGSYTAGVDGQTIKEISNMDIETFITVVQNKLRNITQNLSEEWKYPNLMEIKDRWEFQL